MSSIEVRGMYFEEFEIGQQVITGARTVTESDVVSFAGLSGDYNQIHTDAEFAKSTPYGQRIAHGLLVTSIATGLVAVSGVLEGTTIAFREINKWKFSKPVFIGDTVHVEAEVQKKQALPRLNGGLVEIKINIVNQRDEVVMRGIWGVIMASKEA